MATEQEPRAVGAAYDAENASIVLRLANDCTFSFPVSRYPALAAGTRAQLAAVQIDLDGEALVWDEPNFCVSVPGLIMAALGNWEQWAAQKERELRTANARKGGQTRSPARAAASRANGKKGGRPRKDKSA
jgi:hypothetical protein